MSIPSDTDEPDSPPPGGGGVTSRLVKAAAAAAAAAALVFGAKAIVGDGAATSTADAAGGRPVQPVNGYGPRGVPGPPPGMGFGADVSGATLTKLKDAVASKYPGRVERAMKLPDGSYVVHVIKSGGSEVHVRVSRDFEVLGAEQGGPGHAPGTPGSAPGTPGTVS